MPLLGLGTWAAKAGGETRDAVANALEAGYRHIDTAPKSTTTSGMSVKPYGKARCHARRSSLLPSSGTTIKATMPL
ncbi:MAG: hypothetical protein Ct9H300mP16_13850 [Pseudomonadota bacterium]|nr:MAG: hypothetical protein Ct9H300mP16_13850 [Pseudomonadota bacterium]